MSTDGITIDNLRERLIHLGEELPDEVVAASWLRDGRDRWMTELQQASDPSELAQCALQLEKCVKRRAQPKWWRHERPIWVQGLHALARSSEAIAGCEPERLFHQLVLTLGKLVRTLDLSALGVHIHSVDAGRKRAEELREVLEEDESGEVVYGDAPACDFFLQRKRRRLQPGDAILPPAATRRLQRLARRPTGEVLAELVLEGPAEAKPMDNASAWNQLLRTRLAVFHGGIGTLAAADAADAHASRLQIVCAPDTMRLLLDEATEEVPGHLLRAVCRGALCALSRADGVALFEVSIEDAILSCPMPAYASRIRSKRMLDLGKIRGKVEAVQDEGGYQTLAEFRYDLRDMFQNAIDYHGPRSAHGGKESGKESCGWIAQTAAQLHACVERELPRIIEDLRPRDGSYRSPADALPRPWAVLELAHAAQKASSTGFLRDLPATVIGEMRAACYSILQLVQQEVADRLSVKP
jgi:hypothetical protein